MEEGKRDGVSSFLHHTHHKVSSRTHTHSLLTRSSLALFRHWFLEVVRYIWLPPIYSGLKGTVAGKGKKKNKRKKTKRVHIHMHTEGENSMKKQQGRVEGTESVPTNNVRS